MHPPTHPPTHLVHLREVAVEERHTGGISIRVVLGVKLKGHLRGAVRGMRRCGARGVREQRQPGR